ncbi:polysaccharide biosynthesis tyrosine autokinase [Modicisalibacter luteus]|uniref:Polysaccharide biosynthesis tyrosine autokinase n=1 Tax=Modicisalibacter luteus TaxID=453962 RepID=A0ABV7LYA1_9GAMM|nr:polysaccharide biosynthesis tyrosine autokinase [Halomonas lutea]GHB05446.1 tyrosine protein kinase [Halomonas lutea]
MRQNISSNHMTQGNGDIDFARMFGILIDHKWVIISVTSAFALIGVLYTLLSTPIYQADALVQIEDDQKMNPLNEVTNLLGKEPPSESEIEIIRSRMVLGRAVDILNLDLLVKPKQVPLVGDFLNRKGIERPTFVTEWNHTKVASLPVVSGFLDWLGVEMPAFSLDWGHVWAGESIDVKAMPVADKYLDTTFTLEVIDDQRYSLIYQEQRLGEGRVGTDSEFLNGDVSVTVAAINAPPGATFELTHLRRLKAINNLRYNLAITERGQETGILNWTLTGPDSERAGTTLSTIADIYIAQNIQRQSEEARKSLDFLDSQVPAVHDELRAAEDKLNLYRAERDSIDLTIETSSILERMVNLESQLNELEFAEAEISRRFTPSHPTYAALLEKKSQLNKEMVNLESKVNSLPQTQQEILRMQRDVEVNQEIYVALRNKVQEMQIAEASTVGNVRVLDMAEVLPEPVAPAKQLIVLVATMLGGMVSVGGVLLHAALNRGIETPDELEQLDMPVYATVPLSEEQQKLNRFIRRESGRNDTITAGLLAKRNPADVSVEALRGLRTSLHFAMLDSSDSRILVTGPSPGIGKSFVTVNLAAVCAQAGQRVLIIDGDMRKGHLHSVFGTRPDGGLSDILSDRQSAVDMIRVAEGMDYLHYIARGAAPPNPAELLNTSRLTELLEFVDQHYDLVIIDSPPVLAVTDAAIIGKHVSTTLLVARFQLNSVKEIELARRRLETAGVNVKGAILNAMERKAATAYGYGYYNYAYK